MKRVAAIAALGVLALAGAAPAHPPSNPYDDTVFAPINDEAGLRVRLEVVATGFTAPL